MGFLSFLKKVFSGEDEDEAELDAARARHGIKLTGKDRLEMNKSSSEEEHFGENYDVWEDLRHFRSSFFMGNWAAKKFHVIGEDKVKKQLEELEQKRRAGAEKKARENGWDKWEK